MIAKFKTILAQSLRAGDTSVTSIKVQSITTQEGDVISMSDFPFGNVGYLVIDPETPNTEIVKFTGIDISNNAFTGITRGLPFHLKTGQEETTILSNVKEHSLGAEVIITDNSQWFYQIKRYIDNSVTGSVGNASETTAGTIFTDRPVLTNTPRARAVIVHQQATPDMSLVVEPFYIVENEWVVDFEGGNSPTFTAPTTNPRIDLLVYNVLTQALEIRQGVEEASPTPPTPQYGDIVLAKVYLRPSSTKITDKDITTDAYIQRLSEPTLYGLIPLIRRFGGDGSDGNLVITSGTTTLDLTGQKIFVKNYNYLEISGTGQLNFINPHNDGTLIIFRVKGDCKITSTNNPVIDLRNLGGIGSTGNNAGGFYGTMTGGDGVVISCYDTSTSSSFATPGGGGASAVNNGTKQTLVQYSAFSGTYGFDIAFGFIKGAYAPYVITSNYVSLEFLPVPGAGGGRGSQALTGWGNGAIQFEGTPGNGGRGGGGLLIEVGGNLTLGGGTIDASGSNGTVGTEGAANGGGGAGGSILILYNGTKTGTDLVFNVSGGLDGGGGTTYKGADGIGLILKNKWFL